MVIDVLSEGNGLATEVVGCPGERGGIAEGHSHIVAVGAGSLTRLEGQDGIAGCTLSHVRHSGKSLVGRDSSDVCGGQIHTSAACIAYTENGRHGIAVTHNHITKRNTVGGEGSRGMIINIHTDSPIGRCRCGIRGGQRVATLLVEPHIGSVEGEIRIGSRRLLRDGGGANGAGHIGSGAAGEDQGHSVSTNAIGDHYREVCATTRDDGVGSCKGVGNDGHIGQHLQVDGIRRIIDPVARWQGVG